MTTPVLFLPIPNKTAAEGEKTIFEFWRSRVKELFAACEMNGAAGKARKPPLEHPTSAITVATKQQSFVDRTIVRFMCALTPEYKCRWKLKRYGPHDPCRPFAMTGPC